MIGTAHCLFTLVTVEGQITSEKYGMALTITIMINSNAQAQLDYQERLHGNRNGCPGSRQRKLAINNLCLVLFPTREKHDPLFIVELVVRRDFAVDIAGASATCRYEIEGYLPNVPNGFSETEAEKKAPPPRLNY
jgi:hypothetical protein